MRPKPFAIVTGASLIRVRDEQSNQTPAPKKQKLKGVISPVLLVAAAPLLLCHVAAAQTWPTKPVRLVTAFATGGSSDSIARIIAEPLPSALGQQVVVDNRSGGNGVAGTAIAANAPPDGYIFLVVFDSHATNASLNKKLPYDTQTDFAPVMLLASSPYALLVSPSSSFRSLAEIISAAKAKPGELTPRAPAASAAADTLLSHPRATRRIQDHASRLSRSGASRHGRDGRPDHDADGHVFLCRTLREIAARTRTGGDFAVAHAQLPDVPTVAEQGFPGYEVRSWWGIVAPALTPKPILNQMHAELGKVLARTDVKTKLDQLGATVHASSPDEFVRLIRTEMQLWSKVIRDAKIGQE